jgi:uncharacterized membrane protein YkgB
VTQKQTAVAALIAAVLIVTGVTILASWAWAVVAGVGCGCLTAGILFAAVAILLYDPDTKRSVRKLP